MNIESTYTSISDEELVRRTQGGDSAAFEALCDRHLPRVYNRLRTLLPLEDVEDVAQEVFIAAMRGVERFKGQSLFRTWLNGIVRHKVADYYRRRSRQPETVPLEGKDNLHAQMEGWERRAAVRIVMRRLPSHYQEILLLRFAEGLPFKEIADTLEISLEAAKSRYRRAVAAFGQEWESVDGTQR
jgi:RNA polymerase sigma-70 factor (ECF subfamily)